jgi:diguanylate cyclase (GGDEF)-like protein
MSFLKKLINFFQSTSFLQKILIPPSLAMLLAIIFMTIIFIQTNKVARSTTLLQSSLIPMLEKSAQNKDLLQRISEKFTFATLSSEMEFMQNADEYSKIIKKNLLFISYDKDVSIQSAQKALNEFDLYYKQAKTITITLAKNEELLGLNHHEINKLVLSYNKVSLTFDSLHKEIQSIIKLNTDEIDYRMHSIVINGSISAIVLLLFLFIISYVIYLNFQKSFLHLVEDISNISDNKNNLILALHKFSNNKFGVLSNQLNNLFHNFEEHYDKLSSEKGKVEEMAKRDQLTSLYNRHHLDSVFEELHNNNTPYGIIMLDIDNFKLINDNYGHQIGDEVLVKFAQTLKGLTRDSDIIGRWGGEEFLIIVTQTTIEQLYQIAENLRTRIETLEFNIVGNLSASFGITLSQKDVASNIIIKQADDALYRAKKDGRNKTIIYLIDS